MMIAVPYENGQVFQHFGHTEQFKLYEVQNQEIAGETIVSAAGSGHGALAGFLKNAGTQVLICGGIGGGAKNALAAQNIQVFGGVCGDADQAVKDYLAGTLCYNPDVMCSHHHGEHGESGHTCGEHGCGSHSCGHGEG
mgnify:CR=1 FL=1